MHEVRAARADRRGQRDGQRVADGGHGGGGQAERRGDGGLAMGVGELATLVQERLPVTVLVVDDGGYGMLRYDQTRLGDPEVGVDLVGPDLSALAAAYGLPATAVPSVGDGLASALAKAVGSDGPHLVHVRARLTPPRTTSPRWHED